MGKSSSTTNSSFNQNQNTTENLQTHQTDTSQQTGTQNQTGTGSANQFGTGSVTGSQGPWAQAQPALQSLLSGVQSYIPNTGLNPNQQSAIDQLVKNAGGIPNWQTQAIDLTNKFMTGDPTGLLKPALENYNTALNPIATGDLDPMKTPGIQNILDTIRSDVTNNIRGQFNGAGRDLSGLEQQAIARGFTQGAAPVLFGQYNQNVSNRMGAAGNLYNAAGNTAGAISGNYGQAPQFASYVPQAGALGPQAALEAEALRSGIPLDQLSKIAGITVPIAGLGNQSQQQTQQQQQTQTQEQQLTESQQFAKAISDLLGSGTGTAQTSGSGTSNTSSSPSLLSLIMAGKSLLSDRRAKRDITQVGTLFDGTPVYRFRYLGGRAMQIGLMADEVVPEAVSDFGGLKAVDYEIATANSVGSN